MEVINGEWIMKGSSEDDPDCLRTAEDAAALIQIYGFLPFFSTEIPGFSLEEHTLGSSWWTGNSDDPWMWRMELARHPEIAYVTNFLSPWFSEKRPVSSVVENKSNRIQASQFSKI